MPNKKKKTQKKAPQLSSGYRYVAADLVSNSDTSEYRYVEAELVPNSDGTVTVKMPPNMPPNALINWGRSIVPVTFTS